MKGTILLRIILLLLLSLSFNSGTVLAAVAFSSPAANDTLYLTKNYNVCWTRTADMHPPVSLTIEQVSGGAGRFISFLNSGSTELASCFSWGVYPDLPQVPHRFCLDIAMIGDSLHKECSAPFSILAPSELSIDSAEVSPDPRDSTDILRYNAVIRAEGPDIPEKVDVRFKVYGLGGAEMLSVEETLDLDNSATTSWSSRKYKVPQYGLYRNELIVDTGSAVMERDEGNNKKVTLYAVDPKPDLQVYVKPDSRPVRINNRRSIRAYVKNVGNLTTPETELRFWIEGKGRKTYAIPQLQPGKIWSVERKPKWALKGTKSFKIRANPGPDFDELYEENNLYEGSVVVQGVGVQFDTSGFAPPPDLRVRAWMPQSIKRGERTAVLFEVRNMGDFNDRKADNITLTTTLYGATGSGGVIGDLIETFDIPDLLPGENYLVVQNIKTMGPLNSFQRLGASVKTSEGRDNNYDNNQTLKEIRITN